MEPLGTALGRLDPVSRELIKDYYGEQGWIVRVGDDVYAVCDTKDNIDKDI